MTKSSNSFLPYGRPSLDEADIQAVVDVLRSDWLTTGPKVEEFETAFAKKVGAKYAVVCSNGTTALQLAANALGLDEQSAVIVPTITFLATANAPHIEGAQVIFSDVSPDSGLMEETHLRDALKRAEGLNVRAIFPVHLGGLCVDMEMVARVAAEYGLMVVEDACHALGSTFSTAKGQSRVGSCDFSDATVFSLHPVKTITTGEGGVITTNDPHIYERMARMRNHGMVRDPSRFSNTKRGLDADGRANPWYYEMQEPGYNYRLSDIQCALGLSQLRKLDAWVERRQQFVDLYDRLLGPLAPVVRPLERNVGCRAGWHLYIVRIDFDALGLSRARLMRMLADRGVGTQVHYIPVHSQPYYEKVDQVVLPGSEQYYAQALSLPLFPAMIEEDVVRVCAALQSIAADR